MLRVFMRWSALFTLCVFLFSPLLTKPANGQMASAEEKGFPADNVFHGGDVDTVGVQNGNLHISIPIYSEKQRGGKTLTWSLDYDAVTWLKQYTAFTGCRIRCNPAGYYGVMLDPTPGPQGWRFADPRNWNISYNYPDSGDTCPSTGYPYSGVTNWYVIEPNGTPHPLGLRQETGYGCYGQLLEGPTLDGSGITYDITTDLITLRDGTQFKSGGDIQDANGNLFTSSNNQDSNGRVPVVVANGSYTVYTSPLGGQISGFANTTYTVLDSNGRPEVYTLNYQAIDVATNACGIPSPFLACYEYRDVDIVPASLTLPSGRQYVFTYNNNSPEELASLQLPTGAVISYTYTGRYVVQPGPHGTSANFVGGSVVATRKVTDDGASQTWTYSVGSSVTDPVGNVTTYTFGGVYAPPNPNPTNTLYETQRTYQDSSGHLLKTVATSYTAEWNPVLDTPVNVRPISVTTTLDNGLKTVTQTDYETFTYSDYTGTETATRLNPTEERVYDYASSGLGSLLKRTDFTYLHNVNPAYAPLNIVNKPATVTIYNGSGGMAAQTLYEYDNYSHAGQTFTASGAIQRNPAFSTSYTTRGNETAVSKWRSTDGAYLTLTRQFDDAGNVLSTIDPMGRQSYISYTDSWGDATCAPTGQTAAYPTTATNAKGQSSSTTYNSCNGSVASIIDANSKTATSTYDFMDRPKLITAPDGGTKAFCYSDDPAGTCYSTTSIYTTETDLVAPTVSVLKTALYDSLGRVKETQLNSDPGGAVYVDTQYDQDGRAYNVSNPYRTGDTVYWTTTAYDGLSRVLSVTKPGGSSSSIAYTGNTTTSTDEASHQRKSQTNALGQLTYVWEDPAGLNYQTAYQYDVLGHVQQISQQGGDPSSADWRVRTFTVDSLGELICSANPEIGSPLASPATCPVTDSGSYISGTIRYAYDDDAEVVSRTAPLENQQGISTVVTGYSYEQLGRVSSVSYNDGTPSVAYVYDNDPVTACTAPVISGVSNLIGHMKAMCDVSGSTAWSYDPMGRTKTEARNIGSASDRVDYTYYYNGAVSSLTYPSAGASTRFAVNYAIDTAGRISSVTDNNSVTYAQVTSTWATGAANQWQLGANIQLQNTYNSRLQPLQMTATQISPSNTLFSKTYDFHLGSGDNGNLYGVTDGLDGLGLDRPNGSVTYTYDVLNRVNSAATTGTDCTAMAGGTKDWATSYTVDAWGNLTQKNSTLCTGESMSPTTSTNRNQLVAATYDSAGNATAWNGQGYTYDAEGRMVSGAGTAYTYDGMGERVAKPGKLYWKGVGSTALMETDATDNNPTTYIFFNGARIARVDPSASTPVYYVSDNLGSTSLVTDSMGNILNESLYFPYGGERVVQQDDTANNYKFTGKERDPETGLDDFGARYYNQGLGRFMTPDWNAKPTSVPYASFGDPQTLNLYSYVENGPLNRVDADGHSTLGGYTPVMSGEICSSAGGDYGCVGSSGAGFAGVVLSMEAAREAAGMFWDLSEREPLEEAAFEKREAEEGELHGQQQAKPKVKVKKIGYINEASKPGLNGAQLKLEAFVSGGNFVAYNWQQTVTENVVSADGHPANIPFNDADPGTGMLFDANQQKAAMAGAAENGGAVIYYDRPSDNVGVSFTWHADVSLIGIDKAGNHSVLWHSSWGFSVNGATGKTTLENRGQVPGVEQ